jgi:hypothetical protein
VILESFEAEKRIQQLEAHLEATGNGKVIQLGSKGWDLPKEAWGGAGTMPRGRRT